jgi:2-polyprenyl-3-methyl-5-hydroxy-6-metoxy-1,4-benzoquinol methylase
MLSFVHSDGIFGMYTMGHLQESCTSRKFVLYNGRETIVGACRQMVLTSCRCTQAQLESPTFRAWAERMKEPFWLHRGIWMWCYIAQALDERGMLKPGKRGLGFGVGEEPLSALFAECGCRVLATDLDTGKSNEGWIKTSQHADSLKSLNGRGICSDTAFKNLVNFQFLDMNELPSVEEMGGRFDFIWSNCSLEHLGTIQLSEQFIGKSLEYLKPGGVAVHTTELNISPNSKPLESGWTVLFQQSDFERIAQRVRGLGYRVPAMTFAQGSLPADSVFRSSEPGQETLPLINYKISDELATTSFGFIVERPKSGRVSKWNIPATVVRPKKGSLVSTAAYVLRTEGPASLIRKAAKYYRNRGQ